MVALRLADGVSAGTFLMTGTAEDLPSMAGVDVRTGENGVQTCFWVVRLMCPLVGSALALEMIFVKSNLPLVGVCRFTLGF